MKNKKSVNTEINDVINKYRMSVSYVADIIFQILQLYEHIKISYARQFEYT